jgi:hypothetical protein
MRCSTLSLQLLLTFVHLQVCHGYVSPEIKVRWAENYDKSDALKTIDECVEDGYENDDLYGAVKFMDRFANIKHYPDLKSRQELWEKAKGSWELRLALSSDKDMEFYPHPEFRNFAMAFICIDDDYFGKGIAPSTDFCFVSLAGPSEQDVKRRQVFMEYEDYYINGNQVPGWDLSYFMRGNSRKWVASERKRPALAFTIVAATDTSLVVRGSKTGGIALFRRLPEDMQPAAYGSY